jgi:hypothetical protein
MSGRGCARAAGAKRRRPSEARHLSAVGARDPRGGSLGCIGPGQVFPRRRSRCDRSQLQEQAGAGHLGEEARRLSAPRFPARLRGPARRRPLGDGWSDGIEKVGWSKRGNQAGGGQSVDSRRERLGEVPVGILGQLGDSVLDDRCHGGVRLHLRGTADLFRRGAGRLGDCCRAWRLGGAGRGCARRRAHRCACGGGKAAACLLSVRSAFNGRCGRGAGGGAFPRRDRFGRSRGAELRGRAAGARLRLFGRDRGRRCADRRKTRSVDRFGARGSRDQQCGDRCGEDCQKDSPRLPGAFLEGPNNLHEPVKVPNIRPNSQVILKFRRGST